MATSIRRCDTGLRPNVHFHTAFLDGVYIWVTDKNQAKALRFFTLPAPSNEDVATVAVNTRVQVCKFLAQQGFDLQRPLATDPLAERESLLAQMLRRRSRI